MGILKNKDVNSQTKMDFEKENEHSFFRPIWMYVFGFSREEKSILISKALCYFIILDLSRPRVRRRTVPQYT